MSGICVEQIGPAPEEELTEYRRQKDELRIQALTDPEKQKMKKVLEIKHNNGVTVGLCPTCNHCLMVGFGKCDIECDECLQKVIWF